MQIGQDIVTHGSVERGWIGVEPQALSPELARALQVPERSGVVLTGILHDSPAQRAGLEPGDIITHVNDQAIDGPASLLAAVARLKPGESAELRVLHQRRRVRVTVVPSRRPAQAS